MTKLALPLSLVALALLSACVSYEPAQPAPVVVTSPAPAPVVTTPAPGAVVAAPQVVPSTVALRPGSGRIEAISATPMATASAGGSATSNMRRLAVKMDDGTIQYVDTEAAVNVGDRIQLTQDGYIRRPAP